MHDIFAHRLKSARIKSGFSQQELAERLAVTKQAVSKYETGKMLPESMLLLRIAEVLGQKADYFFRPFSVSLDHLAFRKCERMGVRSVDAIKIEVADQLERYLELENLLGIEPGFNNPLAGFSIQSPEEVEDAVERLLEHWQVGINPLPNIVEMLEDNGVKVLEIDADPDFDGLSAWVGGVVPVIVLNRNMGDVVRKRFTAPCTNWAICCFLSPPMRYTRTRRKSATGSQAPC